MIQILKKTFCRLFFLLIGLLLFADLNAQVLISGKIISADDKSELPGVSVLLIGTNQGVISDINGNYQINVKSPVDILQFSYIGFATQSVVVGNLTTIDVVLELDLLGLDEVIVTAYSEKSKTEISSAVTSLGSEQLNKVTVNSVADMLTGKVAGVHVQTASGQPGQAGDIRIRGVGSVFSTQSPLVVVDGIIGGDYDPNNIESVTILKDAGATGLYGSRAAAGVILITTKSGSKGKGLITAKISRGFKNPEFGNFEVMNSDELYNYHKKIYTPVLFNIIRPKSLLTKDYNWIDNTYKQSDITTAYLSASGAGEKTNYYLSLDFMDDNGTLLSTNYQRLSVRSKVKYSLTDRLSITTNISGNYNKSQYPPWTLAEGAFRLMPWDNPYDADNELVYDIKKAGWYSNVPNNPYHSLKYNKYNSNGVDASGSTSIIYQITDWLKLDSRTSLSSSFGKSENIESPLSYEGESVGGRITNSIYMGKSYGNTSLIKFDKKFGKHSISGLAGVEGGKYTIESGYGGNATGILPGQEVLGVAGSIEKPVGSKAEVASFSMLSQVNYDFVKKYFLTVSVRRDGSSKFSPNSKYANFYTSSASWLISEEEFMKSVSNLNYLKLRGSYGAVGNETFPNNNYYPYFPAYSGGNIYNYQTAYFPSNVGNYNLTWETSYPLNIGIDLGFLKKIEINIDYYDTHIKNLLFQDPLPPSQGFDYQWKNVGEIRNRGLEFNMNGNIIKKKYFSWNLNFNTAANHNELVKLSDKEGVSSMVLSSGTARQILIAGASAFDWYMPKWMGVNPENGQPLWEKINVDPATGIETSREKTSNYTEATFESVGSPFPKMFGGFGTDLSYRGLSLNAAFSYVSGNKIYNATRQGIDNDGANSNVNAFKLQDGMSRWEKTGDIATHPKPNLGGNMNAHEYSSRYLEDGSYLRLRNVTLSYLLPKSIAQLIKLNSFKINLSMDNVKTWTKFTGMDPDVPLFYDGTWTLPGTSSFKYPLSRQYIIGIELSF